MHMHLTKQYYYLRNTLAALITLFMLSPAIAAEGPAMLLHMLDYIRVDYPATVNNRQVIDIEEYTEMQEFSTQVIVLTGQLDNSQDKALLLQEGRQLQSAIEQRLPPGKINALVQSMSERIATNYPVTITPRRTPPLAVGERLYQQECASCHGVNGDGNGPLAAQLNPPPINFQEMSRQRERSVWGLYSAITQGVEGTAMPAFDALSEEQRWALAFHVANYPFRGTLRSAGQALWQENPAAREWIPDLASVSKLTPAEAEERFGMQGAELLAYLRSAPQAVSTTQGALVTARVMLENSLESYRLGNRQQAYQQSLSAYLDGFELGESALNNVAPQATRTIEQAMLGYREKIRAGAPLHEIEALHAGLLADLDKAISTLAESHMSASAGFFSAFVILLREGLEAILLLAAMAAVLIKSGRRDALPYLHAGWVAALGFGSVTWAVSNYLFTISGAGRELTEGLTALLACVVLLYVGFWLHDKTQAKRWREFVDGRIRTALQGRSLWVLTFIAFVAVYREVFETVLFYQALWLQAETGVHSFLWSGIAAAAVSLVALGWLLLRTSVRLPLKLVFRINAAVLFVLAVAFAGHGVSSLQEAGWLSIGLINFPSFDLLGIYPTLETLGAQLVVITVVGLIFLRGRIHGRQEANGLA
jgi:high-affinity iron transporter